MAEFQSGMGRSRAEFPSKFPERHGPKGGQGAEFPSKFPSGVYRETENPAASTADNKAIYRVTVQYSTPDQASKRTERTEVEYPGGV